MPTTEMLTKLKPSCHEDFLRARLDLGNEIEWVRVTDDISLQWNVEVEVRTRTGVIGLRASVPDQAMTVEVEIKPVGDAEPYTHSLTVDLKNLGVFFLSNTDLSGLVQMCPDGLTIDHDGAAWVDFLIY